MGSILTSLLSNDKSSILIEIPIRSECCPVDINVEISSTSSETSSEMSVNDKK